MKQKKKGVPIRVGPIRKKLSLTKLDKKELTTMASLLGLSVDKAMEALLLFSVDEDNVILLDNKNGRNDLDISEVHEINRQIIGSTEKTANPTHFSLNMALTMYPKNEDPICITLNDISLHFSISKPDFLKQLYFEFIHSNFESYIEAMDENQVVKKEHVPLNADTISDFILGAPSFSPYNLSTNPWNDFKRIELGEIRYDFLQAGPHKHTQSVSISYKKQSDDLLFKTIHLVCKVHFRDRSSFFQMLYMYYLRSNEILTHNFSLNPDWKKILSKIKKVAL